MDSDAEVLQGFTQRLKEQHDLTSTYCNTSAEVEAKLRRLDALIAEGKTNDYKLALHTFDYCRRMLENELAWLKSHGM